MFNNQELIPLFTYGTLRINQPLHGWVENITESIHANVIGFDAKLYVSNHLHFPYLVEQEGSITHGDLFVVKNNLQFADLVNMEIAAGYKMKTIETNVGMTAITFFCDLEKVFLVNAVDTDDWVEFKNWTKKNKISAF
jgi:gamma-glutamylcyclotransferase (GGCT)/AIG2-like uncharacterized protein YtfP